MTGASSLGVRYRGGHEIGRARVDIRVQGSDIVPSLGAATVSVNRREYAWKRHEEQSDEEKPQ